MPVKKKTVVTPLKVRRQIRKRCSIKTTRQIKELREQIKPWKMGLDNFGFINEDECQQHLSKPCLARLSEYHTAFLNKYGTVPSVFWTHPAAQFYEAWDDYSKKQQNNAIKYVKWLAQDSQYSHIFINKDPIDILSKGALLDCTGESASFLCQASISLRWFSEQKDRMIDHWPEMVKDIPLQYPHNYNISPYFIQAIQYGQYHYTIWPHDIGHSIFNHAQMTKAGLENMILGNPLPLHTFNEHPLAFPLISCWQGGYGADLELNVLKTTRKKKSNSSSIFFTPCNSNQITFKKENAKEYFTNFLNANLTEDTIKKIGGIQ